MNPVQKHQKKIYRPDIDENDLRVGESMSEDDDDDMSSDLRMPNMHQIGKTDSFALIQDAESSQGGLSGANTFNNRKSDNSLNLLGGGLFGNSGKFQNSDQKFFECMTPVADDSSMPESPNFFQSFGKNNGLAAQFQMSMSSQSDIPNHKLFDQSDRRLNPILEQVSVNDNGSMVLP